MITYSKIYKGQIIRNYTMKQKLSISIEKETIDKIDNYISDGAFRNKSHVVEFALNKFMAEENGN